MYEGQTENHIPRRGDQEPGLEPGDVIIVLDQKVHPMYQRQGDDLITKMDVKLVKALCRFRKTVTTLDHRTFVITSSLEFPEKDPEHLMYQLERLLPSREDVMLMDDMEEVDLEEGDVQARQRKHQREVYQEDEDAPRSGVQCQT
ncbi:dnaJ homolog subfamily A member 4-like [Boleophthalmus pectinirostris]|uniref:dnaJ homolog subfamily A member 4-like n=1 Tax=Boleophthalmus pectinirostris TaxID=150288 RepID=UPI00242D8FF8|nr:dnaJ homolog subfamily A member 4-like [Boleophthalmus pectinirostris]